MKIVGIDASLTSTGIAVIDTETKTYTIQSKKKGAARLSEIRDSVLNEIKDADLVVIEGYAFARPNQAHQIGELGGVLRVMMYENGIKWIEIPPPRAKKFVTGKGNSQKDLIMQQVYKRWGVECETSDEADAFVLAKIGQALLGDRDNLTTFQLEVISEIEGKVKK